MKKLITSLLFLSIIFLGIGKALPAQAQSQVSELQVVTSPKEGGDMKWVLTVKGDAVFPDDFGNGEVYVLRKEGGGFYLRNMWRFDPNDNVWVWEQYIPVNIIGLMIDTDTPINWKFLQTPPYWGRWYWGNVIVRDFWLQ